MTEKKKLDVHFFKPFVDGTLLTLKVQCTLEAKAAKPFYKHTQPDGPFEIAAVIGLTSSAFMGSITLCFTKSVYLKIMNNMLGEEHKEITAELADGGAELLNIIFGQAKMVLNEEGYDIQKAIPTVIRGTQLQTQHVTSTPVVVLPFDTEAGRFQIEISTEPLNIA